MGTSRIWPVWLSTTIPDAAASSLSSTYTNVRTNSAQWAVAAKRTIPSKPASTPARICWSVSTIFLYSDATDSGSVLRPATAKPIVPRRTSRLSSQDATNSSYSASSNSSPVIPKRYTPIGTVFAYDSVPAIPV